MHCSEEGQRQKKRQRSSLLFGGRTRFKSLPHKIFFTRMILKKRMIGIKTTWRKGCFEKMDDHPVHTIPNHYSTKWMFFQKLLFKSSLLLNGHSAAFKDVPQTAARTFAFSSAFILLLWIRPFDPWPPIYLSTWWGEHEEEVPRWEDLSGTELP